MKKIIFALVLALSSLNAYYIGGAYATLKSCNWVSYGYQYGYVGTYEVNGEYYKVFFGSNYCEY